MIELLKFRVLTELLVNPFTGLAVGFESGTPSIKKVVPVPAAVPSKVTVIMCQFVSLILNLSLQTPPTWKSNCIRHVPAPLL